MQKLGPTSESRIAEISWPFGLVFAIPDTKPGVGQGGISNGLCSIKLMAAFHGVY